MITETKHVTLFTPPNEITLESGKKLGPITVAYETLGTLNADASNAVFVCHALSGDAHVAGRYSAEDTKPGWWEEMVGAGKAFDTNTYFVICANVLGGCKGTTGPNSIDPATKKPYGLAFPVVSIADMVRVQKELIDHLGITRLHSVVGGSMGGMQALEWGIRYSENVRSVIAIATTPKLSPQSIAFDEVGRNAIMKDPDWQKGNYYGKDKAPNNGLAIARMIGHITYLSDEAMRTKFGRRLQEREKLGYDFSTEFEVESYLRYQGDKFVERFDANTYLYLTKAMDYFDLEVQYGSVNKAFERTNSKFL
ncbi:MAG: homoserine O-acetyltransferase, partial [Candidatus Omnitrophica bacterium]|nr:homoserine O-acetyltransferase [Candidatus Omnitrophota bacterium]